MPGLTLSPGADASALAYALDALDRDLAGLDPSVADRALVVVGELAANAAEHGKGETRLDWTVTDGAVVLTVTGEGPSAEAILRATLPGPNATEGRGLVIVADLSTRVEDVPGGLRVIIN